jgi:hypothetical protein
MAEDYLKGLDEVMQNLNKEIQAIEGRTSAGLIAASVVIQRASVKENPRVPVDTSNLEHSFFRATKKGQLGSSKGFTGEDAGKMASEHSSAITEATAIAKMYPGPLLILGYSANYAGFVHENMEADFTSARMVYDRKTHEATIKERRSGAGPKFLEAHIIAKKSEVLQIIRDFATIKK